MADEIRRSGRATKGQHNKDREEADGGPKQKGKAKGKKAKAEPEPEEEEDELIRCVCGTYEEEEDSPRSMICCDKCSAWQHNDCMGLPEDYSPAKYFCEKCKPSDHKELLAAMKRGEKPWEDRAVERERLKAEKEAKKKGKKAGRKSAARASDAQRTPTLEPEESVSSRKRKHDESPALESKSKKARSSLRVEADGQVEEQTEEKEKEEEEKQELEAEEAVVEPEEQNPLLAGVAKDAKDIANPTRSKIASNIVKSFIEQANGLVQSGAISPSKGETPASLGTRIALQVEHAVYHVRSGGQGEPSDAYRDQMRTILNNIKSNADLAARLMNNNLTADKLAAMEPKDMATDAQKQKDAEEKMKMDKQHVLVEEQGPRIRKTHKGEEYVDESHQVAEPTPTKPPSKRQSTMGQDAETKSPTSTGPSEKSQSMRKPSAAGKGKPFGDPRRKSSSNFDIDRVWSGVQGSPTEGEAPKIPEGQSRASPPPLAGAAADADPEVDRLLKDEDNESAPYSPKEYVEEGVVWRGKVNGGSLGTFNTVAKFAAGCQPEVENLSMTWSEVIPSEIKLHGRIQPSKADEYLCGLEYSNTTELVIVSLAEPKDLDDQAQFTKFFNYLKTKGRYGVGSQHSVPAIKDIYLLPMEIGQPLPTVMRALEHAFADPVTERSFLVPIVIKWTELPHNAERARQQQREQAAQSPSVGPPVAQTPITPRENQMQFDAHHPQPPQAQTQTQAMNGGSHPPPTPAQYSTPPRQQSQQPIAHAPVQAPIPSNQSPAATNALRILGPEMAACPAVVDLIAQAPNAGENEFNIIKECIEENAEAGKSLGVLTVMLQQKYQSQRSSREQAASQGQATVLTPT